MKSCAHTIGGVYVTLPGNIQSVRLDCPYCEIERLTTALREIARREPRLCPKCDRNWISGDEECDCSIGENLSQRLQELEAALVRIVTHHGHKYTCSAVRGMERDCTCGWLEIRELVKTIPSMSAT